MTTQRLIAIVATVFAMVVLIAVAALAAFIPVRSGPQIVIDEPEEVFDVPVIVEHEGPGTR